jgi:hypothetical protein
MFCVVICKYWFSILGVLSWFCWHCICWLLLLTSKSTLQRIYGHPNVSRAFNQHAKSRSTVCVDCTILQEEVTCNNQQIQCQQNQLNTTKIENQYLQITTQNRFCWHCICWLLHVTSSCRMVQSTHTSWFGVLVEGFGDIRMSIDSLKSWLADK